MHKEILRGKFYFKKTWFGLVLMVQVKYQKSVNHHGYAFLEDIIKFRKAKEEDLHLGSATLINNQLCYVHSSKNDLFENNAIIKV